MNPILKSFLWRLARVAFWGGIALGLTFAAEQVPALASHLTGVWQTIWTILGGALMTAIEKAIRRAKELAEEKK
jgi:hypothetical protein